MRKFSGAPPVRRKPPKWVEWAAALGAGRAERRYVLASIRKRYRHKLSVGGEAAARQYARQEGLHWLWVITQILFWKLVRWIVSFLSWFFGVKLP
jgi:hypothetical protein